MRVRMLMACAGTKLAVKPGTDAFVTRAAVMKAMHGHVLGKAGYGGLFRRPR